MKQHTDPVELPHIRELSKVQKAVFLATVSGFIALAGLTFCELFLRLIGHPFGNVLPSEFAIARFDSDLGWSYVPNRSTEQEFGIDKRTIWLHFDKFGSRVEQAGIQRDPAKPTMLIVGCSYMMGHGVRAEASVAGLLHTLEGFPFQVVNLAVQGFGTDQALLMLERHVQTFNTKVIVYGFMCDHLNRNENDDRRILFPRLRFVGTKPKYELDSGRAVLAKKPQRYEDMFLDLRLRGMLRLFVKAHTPPPTVHLTRALLREMQAFAESRKLPLIVIDWHMGSEISLCPADMFDGIGLDLIRAVDGAPPDWTGWMVPGDFHPDARAHFRVAGLLLERLKARQLVNGDVNLPASLTSFERAVALLYR
jgi:hypothetical protein